MSSRDAWRPPREPCFVAALRGSSDKDCVVRDRHHMDEASLQKLAAVVL